MSARRFVPWLMMAVVLGAALLIGGRPDGSPHSVNDQVRAIAREVRCPTCESQSAADSNAPASEAIRNEIRTQLKAGRSPGQIRAFLVSRFGTDILLKPESRGVAGLVWAIPVVVLVIALAAVALAFRRWKRESRLLVATDEDRVTVARALNGNDR